MAYSDEVLADSPAGYWRLNETSAGPTVDSSGNGHNDTGPVGGVTLGVASLLAHGGGVAAAFNGIDGRIPLPTSTTFEATAAGGLTVELWVRVDNPAADALQTIIDKTAGSTATKKQWNVTYDNRVSQGSPQRLRFAVGASASAWVDWTGSAAANALAAGGHLVARKSGNVLTLWWNGAQVATSTVTAWDLAANTDGVGLGGYFGGTTWLDGAIDEVAIYPSALSDARISAHYDASRVSDSGSDRLRYNGLVASLGAPLGSTDSNIVFSGALSHAAGSVATLGASEYLPLSILDASGKPLEIVHLTAYTSGALTGTIGRGKEGTAGQAHAQGATVYHGPTVADILDLESVNTAIDLATLDHATVTRDPADGGILLVTTGDETLADPFLDQSRIVAAAGVTFTVASPTQYGSNPIYPPSGNDGDTWDADRSYATVIYQGGTYHLFYYGLTADWATGVTCYASSADGLTWTKPSLASPQAGTNVVVQRAFSSAYYDDDTSEWVLVTEPDFHVHTSSSPDGPYTERVSETIPSDYNEGKAITRTPSGKWVGYYSHGHAAQARRLGAWLSDGTSLDDTWTNLGDVLMDSSQDDQRYSLGIDYHDGLYYGFVMVYEKTTELIWVDLYTSRDALTWRRVKERWVDLGASGTWNDGMILNGSKLAEVGNDWHFYYTGTNVDHAGSAASSDGRVGRATIGKGRVGVVTGPGSLTTRTFTPTPGATLTVNANGTGGSVVVDVLDADGNVIPHQGATITTDVYAQTVTMPTGRPIALRFTLTGTATLHGYTVA